MQKNQKKTQQQKTTKKLKLDGPYLTPLSKIRTDHGFGCGRENHKTSKRKQKRVFVTLG